MWRHCSVLGLTKIIIKPYCLLYYTCIPQNLFYISSVRIYIYIYIAPFSFTISLSFSLAIWKRKTCSSLLDKQGWTHKRWTPTYGYRCIDWPAKNIYLSIVKNIRFRLACIGTSKERTSNVFDTNSPEDWQRETQDCEFLPSGGARGVVEVPVVVIDIVVGNGHGDMSSNPGRDWLHFT